MRVSGKFPLENSHPENSHSSNPPGESPPWKISTQKVPTRNIPTYVFKHFVFSLLSPLSLILFKRLFCISVFKKCWSQTCCGVLKKLHLACYSGNVWDMIEMFSIFSFRKCSTLVKWGRTKKKFLKNPKKLVKILSACLKRGMKSKLRPVIAPDKRRLYMTLWSRTLYCIYGPETSFICQEVSPI